MRNISKTTKPTQCSTYESCFDKIITNEFRLHTNRKTETEI